MHYVLRSAVLAILTVCLLAALGCTPLGGSRPLVKIGLAAPFEGSDRSIGYEALAGVKVALAERNAAGGVGGYMIELVALNDFGEPGEARLQAGELAADPAVVGVVTGWTGPTARASLPVYRHAGLALVVPWSVAPELADPDAGVVLVAADAQRVAEVLVGAVAATGPRRLVVVGDEPSAAPYLESLGARGLSAQLVPPPGGLVDNIPATSSQGEVAATRLNLNQAEPPDVLLLVTDGITGGEVLLDLAALNWRGAVFGGGQADSVHLVNVAGVMANGVTFASPAPAGKDESGHTEGELALGKDEFGPRAVAAYDATQVLLDAIEIAIRQNGRPTRRGVALALPTVQRPGLTGPIAFDATGRRIDAPVWLYRILDGDYPGQMLSTSQPSDRN